MAKREPFPYDAPTDPAPHPKMTGWTADSLREGIDAIRWFIRVRGKGAEIRPESPLARWMENLERLAKGKPVICPPEALDDQQNWFGVADIYHACALAWSVCVLEPRERKRDYAAKSLVSKELLGRDEHEAMLPAMPGGFGTIYLGARCVHCGDGAVKLEGKKSKGVDVTWWPRGFKDKSLEIVFERKDLAFDRSVHGDADAMAKRICDRLEESCEKLPEKRDGLTRVCIVGLTCEHEVARALQQRTLVVSL